VGKEEGGIGGIRYVQTMADGECTSGRKRPLYFVFLVPSGPGLVWSGLVWSALFHRVKSDLLQHRTWAIHSPYLPKPCPCPAIACLTLFIPAAPHQAPLFHQVPTQLSYRQWRLTYVCYHISPLISNEIPTAKAPKRIRWSAHAPTHSPSRKSRTATKIRIRWAVAGTGGIVAGAGGSSVRGRSDRQTDSQGGNSNGTGG